ncbi:hypothetical protein HF086_002882 [Spodoptera exigua]|uniref:PiggyBac transposable element-derived protein domain-containing protein n=1 Tax=Spodoptera exigua TaxID=7107 RepID=A0A922M8A5_SPOEX|nr:hypothetical protein HF086_002882 [Spodoptera exigua]
MILSLIHYHQIIFLPTPELETDSTDSDDSDSYENEEVDLVDEPENTQRNRENHANDEWGDIDNTKPDIDEFTDNCKPNIADNCITPADFYSLFVKDEIIDQMVLHTNNYAQDHISNLRNLKLKSRLQDWTPMNRAELKKFLGVLLAMGLAKLETKRKWATLATSLNSLGGANKDGQGWAKYWAEKKCALKKHCAQLSSSMRLTGGGTASNLPTLSALDQRLVAVMGGHEFGNLPPATPTPTPVHSHHTTTVTIPQPRRRRSLIPRAQNADMEQFARIEERRVEAEMKTAEALAKIAEHMGTIGCALLEISRKMPEP